MHYRSDAFALNKDMPTITKKDGSRIDENTVFTKVGHVRYIVLLLNYIKWKLTNFRDSFYTNRRISWI